MTSLESAERHHGPQVECLVLFDENAGRKVREARQSIRKVWLSMCLGSAAMLAFIALTRQLY